MESKSIALRIHSNGTKGLVTARCEAVIKHQQSEKNVHVGVPAWRGSSNDINSLEIANNLYLGAPVGITSCPDSSLLRMWYRYVFLFLYKGTIPTNRRSINGFCAPPDRMGFVSRSARRHAIIQTTLVVVATSRLPIYVDRHSVTGRQWVAGLVI